ncbi:MAG TPA: hypothetical protein VM120_01450 [Bryobacteraceae bacterium]|nr:hypothetical protein [Bryobacteraceae bacterium]
MVLAKFPLKPRSDNLRYVAADRHQSEKCCPVRVMDQPVQVAIGDRRISDLRVPTGDQFGTDDRDLSER